MGELLGLTGLTRDDWITLILALPWPFILLGRLVPRALVEERVSVWRQLYEGSEASRERGLEAMERGADAIEATRAMVESALLPLQRAREEVDRDVAP